MSLDTIPDTTFEAIVYQVDGPVATITLNRPKAYNAFDKQQRADITSVLEIAEADADVRVVIIKGAGAGFSAGGDVTDFDYNPISKLIVGEFKPFFDIIHNGNKVYIAQIHGSCAGIATAFALNCDFVTMADTAALYLAFANIALVPDGGASFHLAGAMGYRRALEAIIDARQIPASECLDLGLANKVFPEGDLDAETRAWANRLASRAPLTMAATKRLMRGMSGKTCDQVLLAEAEAQGAMMKTNDFKRGIAAFMSKSKPTFRGD